LTSTVHDLDVLIHQIGKVGQRLSDMGAAEGAAGNLSICFREQLYVRDRFPDMQIIDLPVPAPDLAGATLIVTGSGRRLRDIAEAPTANLACIVVERDGCTGKMFTAPDCGFRRVTSEFNSHLAVHHDQMRTRHPRLHTVLHAQPLFLTYLSHLAEYQEEAYLNCQLLRWQPETILNFPQGLGVLPFLLPGSAQLTVETMLALRDHSMVIWSQHGVIVRADASLLQALDLLEYAETAAHYEFLNLTAGGRSEGLNPDHIREVAKSWKIDQNIF
jgi:rhamnulose-1-phosphate aldolase